MTEKVGPMVKSLARQHFAGVVVLGPRPANIEKKSNQFTWSLLLKSQDLTQLHNLLSSFELNFNPVSSVTYKIDVDPYTML
jgi:primosomal protein N' (replication factor Y) (superfamily II helicase)